MSSLQSTNSAATQKWYRGLTSQSSQVVAAQPVVLPSIVTAAPSFTSSVPVTVKSSKVAVQPTITVKASSSGQKSDAYCPTGTCPEVLKEKEKQAKAAKIKSENEKKKLERKNKSLQKVEAPKVEVPKVEVPKVEVVEVVKAKCGRKDKKRHHNSIRIDDDVSSCSSSSSSSCSSSSSSSSSSCSSSSSSSCSSISSSCPSESCPSEPCPPEPCPPEDKSCVTVETCDEPQDITNCDVTDNCRALTLDTLFRVWKSKKSSAESKRIAKDFLREVRCPPSCIGVIFWDEFCAEPFIGDCTEGCEQKDTCAEIKYIVDDCNGVKVTQFNFVLNKIPCDGVVLPIVYPFGCKCVPGAFQICEYAKFRILAFKKPKKCENNVIHCDDAKKIVDWCESIKANNTHIDVTLINTCTSHLEGVTDGGDAKFGRRLEKCRSFLKERLATFHTSQCNQCQQTRPKCHCDIPTIPDSPFCCYTIKGTWKCEPVDCCVGGGCDKSECVKYRIVFDKDSCCHEDGSQLDLSHFSGSRFNKLIFVMKPQFLCFVDCDDDCLDCDKPKPTPEPTPEPHCDSPKPHCDKPKAKSSKSKKSKSSKK
jgi:hypothetical protein